MGEKGEGSGGKGREVGVRGEGSGECLPPCPPLRCNSHRCVDLTLNILV